MGTDLDRWKRVRAGRRVRCLPRCWISCLVCSQALFIYLPLAKQGVLWWRPEEVQFPVLSLDLQLEMLAH